MVNKKLDTETIAKAILDTVKKYKGKKVSIKEVLPFARCVEITINNDRDVPDTIPAVRFCAETGLPVCFAHLKTPHNQETIAYAAKRCMGRRYKGKEAIFSEKIFHLAFSKINMWGEKYSKLGTPKMLAVELLKMLDKETINKLKKLKKQKIVFIGDSLMAWLHWGAWGGYPDILSEMFKIINKKVVVINAGIGGQTSWQGLARFEKDVIAQKPDLCFVGFGGNDLSFTKGGTELKWMAKFRKSMTAMIKMLKKKGIKQAFVNGSRQYFIDDAIYTREVTNAIEKMGRDLKVPVIDSHRFTWNGPKESWLCFDDLHLSNLGQKKFAKEIVKFLIR